MKPRDCLERGYGKKRGRGKMQILSVSEGAVRTVLHLASVGSKKWVASEEICRDQDITPAFFIKITRPLLREGIITSVRGVGGGFRLGRPAAEITLLEVIEATQGPFFFNHCLVGPGKCARDQLCPVHPVWKEVRKQTEATLSSWNFEDLAKAGPDIS